MCRGARHRRQRRQLAFGIVERDVVFFQLFYNDVRAMSVMLRALPGVSPGDVLYDVATVAACA